MRRPLRLLADVRWAYPRRLTTVAVAAVALVGAALAWALLPSHWRPGSPLWLLLAASTAYVALRLGAHTGWTKRFKHELLDPLGGDVDDAQTWGLAVVVAAAVLAVVALVGRV